MEHVVMTPHHLQALDEQVGVAEVPVGVQRTTVDEPPAVRVGVEGGLDMREVGGAEEGVRVGNRHEDLERVQAHVIDHLAVERAHREVLIRGLAGDLAFGQDMLCVQQLLESVAVALLYRVEGRPPRLVASLRGKDSDWPAADALLRRYGLEGAAEHLQRLLVAAHDDGVNDWIRINYPWRLQAPAQSEEVVDVDQHDAGEAQPPNKQKGLLRDPDDHHHDVLPAMTGEYQVQEQDGRTYGRRQHDEEAREHQRVEPPRVALPRDASSRGASPARLAAVRPEARKPVSPRPPVERRGTRRAHGHIRVGLATQHVLVLALLVRRSGECSAGHSKVRHLAGQGELVPGPRALAGPAVVVARPARPDVRQCAAESPNPAVWHVFAAPAPLH
mmetsp:Transcript_74006/g.216810  ORF Transcript_74006/g.216810 Transcript_74006/m.216810 type:complete len:388 (-) Transcript_74006:222-1385(-)